MKIRESLKTRGQNFVEFAIIAPVLLLLVLIIIDLGRITYSYSALHNAAREGARYGVINPANTGGIEDRVREYAVGLDQSALTVIPLYNGVAETITVTAIYQFRTASPILWLLTNNNAYTLEAVSLKHTEE